jgi:hypothetical protein
MAVAGYLALAAVELPALWRRPDRRGELWVTAALLLIGLLFAVIITMGYRPVTVWKLIEAIFRPVGELLFKPPGGG